MSSEIVSTIFSQLSCLLASADPQGSGVFLDERVRAKALYLSQQLTTALQKPADAALELGLLPTISVCVRIGIQIGVFNILAESKTPKTAHQLADETKAEKLLIVRMMRVLATNGTIEEVGMEEYRATPITCALAKPAIQAGSIHFWDQYVCSLSKLPQYLADRGVACPNDPDNGLFQFSHGTNLESFQLWRSKPDVLDNFNTLMEGVRGDKPSWVEWFPIQDTILSGSDPASEAPILVDIGGARGHDLIAFDQRYPQPPGKLVLEDLPAVIDDIRSLDPKIKRVKHDFFQPQPIQGARVYFFCHIFHCWPDKDCLRILQNLRGAMKRGYSKVIINEFILPDTGCPFYPASLDWVMLGLHASMDRTAGQWKELLETGGFKVDKIWSPPGNGQSVIEASVSDDGI